jgi:hypothetical protein
MSATFPRAAARRPGSGFDDLAHRVTPPSPATAPGAAPPTFSPTPRPDAPTASHACAVGEPLNPSTFVEHFEKALPGYTGAYAYLLRAFAQSIPDGFPLLNREQDLGLEGLRRAKEGSETAGGWRAR